MNSQIHEIARLEHTNQQLRDICRLHIRRIEKLEAENAALLRELESVPQKGTVPKCIVCDDTGSLPGGSGPSCDGICRDCDACAHCGHVHEANGYCDSDECRCLSKVPQKGLNHEKVAEIRGIDLKEDSHD